MMKKTTPLLILLVMAVVTHGMLQEPYFLLSTLSTETGVFFGPLVRASLDFSQQENVTAASGFFSMDYDHNDKLLFYAALRGEIGRCPLAGEDACTVITDLGTDRDVTALAVDYDAKRVYWAQYGPEDESSNNLRQINSCKYDGSDVRLVYQAPNCPRVPGSTRCQIESLAVDVKSKTLYWSEKRLENPKVPSHEMVFRKSGLDGSNAVTVTELHVRKGLTVVSCNIRNKKCVMSVYGYKGFQVVDMDTGIQYQIPETLYPYAWATFASHGGLLYLIEENYKNGMVFTPCRMELSGYGATQIANASSSGFHHMIIVDGSERAARTKPFLEFTLDAQDNTEFVCWMPESGAASFLVNWLSGSETLKADVQVTTEKTVLKLSSVDVNQLQTKLSCQVTEGSGAAQTSNEIYLPGYVRVHPRELILREGVSAEVQIQANLPMRFFQAEQLMIGAKHKYSLTGRNLLDDHSVLMAKQPVGTPASTPYLRSKLIVDNSNWQDTHILTLKADEDGIHTETRISELTIMVGRMGAKKDSDSRMYTYDMDDDYNHRQLYYAYPWGNLQVPTKVTVEDRDTDNSCGAFGTARMRTTDGVYFDHQYQGEFVFYKHIDGSYQANLLLASCGGTKATCVCALAARADDEVIVMDKCPRETSTTSESWRSSPISIYRLQFGNETLGADWWEGPTRDSDAKARSANHKKSNLSLMKYSNKDNTYQIDFPHRGALFVSVNAIGSLHVFYKPAASDYGKSYGLCGYYDRDDANDLKLRDGTVVAADNSAQFSEGWRATASEHLFAGVEERAATAPRAYCYLDYGGSYDYSGRSQNCRVNAERQDRRLNRDVYDISKFLVTYKPRLGTSLLANTRSKRSLSQAASFDPFAQFKVDSTYQPQAVTWPNNGLTEAQAKKKCSDDLAADTGVQNCVKVMANMNSIKEKMISTCTQDIRLSIPADKSTKNIIQALLETCVQFVMSLDDKGDELPAPPGGVTRDELQQAVCPIYCQTGVFESVKKEYIGTCKCPGKRSVDSGTCLPQNAGDQPVITNFDNDGICDVSKQRCDVIIVKGKNIAPTATAYKSKTYPLMVSPRPWPNTIDVIYIDSKTLAFKTPRFTGPYSVNINGLTDGTSRYFVVYNSLCMNCKRTTTDFDCSVKPGYCVVQDDWMKCHESNEATNTWNYFCENDVINGTTLPRSEPEQHENGVAIGIGVTVAILVLVAAVAGVVWYLHKKRSSKSSGVTDMRMASPPNKQGHDNPAAA